MQLKPLLFGILLMLFYNCVKAGNKPFICDSVNLKIWNGTEYVPFPIKGVNFGVTVPGAHPGEINVSRDQYGRWLGQIQEAGFNVIRLYTLHFPSFYETLDSFNLANPNSPLFIIQNIWLEEEIPGYTKDLFDLSNIFQNEIEDNIDCIHGNKNIPFRTGKAYGIYSADISKWVCAYIIGREVFPEEVIKTNQVHNTLNSSSGNFYSINNSTPAEAWLTGFLNHVNEYEDTHYNQVKPLSFSSWPTLDPLHHPEEKDRMEDTVSIDMATVQLSSLTAGYFVSYNAYPYYPGFISNQTNYQSCTDYLGQNSFVCYLQDLRSHYSRFPLVIGETGCPSSWGVAHYAQNGVHHGGFDEIQQGQNNMRLAENIVDAGCAGSIMFNWMDEWFKRTWITDLMDADPERRILWHNITAAEQNFGLMGFQQNLPLSQWQQFSSSSLIKSIDASADDKYFHVKLHMDAPGVLDTIMIALDTYNASLGESILPNGRIVSDRAEFYLQITNYEANLFVTEAYDMYGVWYGNPAPGQVYKSVVSNGGNWNLVRWKNSDTLLSTQYIGHLKVNRMNLPESSLDAIHIDSSFVDIRLPWTLLNFSDPSQMKVIHGDSAMIKLNDAISNGISATVFYNGSTFHPSTRFTWPTWNSITNLNEYLKESYFIIKDNLYVLPGGPIANLDSFVVNTASVFTVSTSDGLLKNDYLIHGYSAQTYLESNTSHGFLFLSSDGSFTFYPEAGFVGKDTFSYRIFNGPHLSEPTKVILDINTGLTWATIYPNPGAGPFSVSSLRELDKIEVFDDLGKCIYTQYPKQNRDATIPEFFAPGIYFARLYSGKLVMNKKFVTKY